MSIAQGYSGVHSVDLIQGNERKNTWRDFHLVPMKRPEFQRPQPNIQSISVPGTNKTIDIVQSLPEGLTYGLIQGTWEFAIDHEQWNSWDEAYRELAKYINGQKMTVMLDEGTLYGYTGRLRVSGYTPGQNWSTITIEYILDGGKRIVSNLIHKYVMQNGLYRAEDDGAEGYIDVTVEVPQEQKRLMHKNITKNGSYSAASDGYDGYSGATVNVTPKLQSKSVTQNGTYTPDNSYDGLSSVSVNVEGGSATLQEKTATENGDVLPDTGYDGLSKVSVNVVPPLQEVIAIENGEIVPDEEYYGISKVTVDVDPILQNKTISLNGTYTPDIGYDGFGQVTVDISGGTDVKPGDEYKYKPDENSLEGNATTAFIVITGCGPNTMAVTPTIYIH